MKKMMIACAVVFCACVMTACNGEGCYKVTMKSGENTNVVYVYGNSDDVDLTITKAKQAAALLNLDFDAKRQKVSKSQEDCHE